MKDKTKKLIELIKDYRNKINIVYKLLFQQLDKEEGDERPMSGSFPDININLFKFHGTGCYIEYQGQVLDFDFDIAVGTKYEILGFDPYFIAEYAKSINHSDTVLHEGHFLKKEFDKMITNNILYEPNSIQSNNLYYFVEDRDLLEKDDPWDDILREGGFIE